MWSRQVQTVLFLKKQLHIPQLKDRTTAICTKRGDGQSNRGGDRRVTTYRLRVDGDLSEPEDVTPES